jgi:hypothetical protein
MVARAGKRVETSLRPPEVGTYSGPFEAAQRNEVSHGCALDSLTVFLIPPAKLRTSEAPVIAEAEQPLESTLLRNVTAEFPDPHLCRFDQICGSGKSSVGMGDLTATTQAQLHSLTSGGLSLDPAGKSACATPRRFLATQ